MIKIIIISHKVQHLSYFCCTSILRFLADQSEFCIKENSKEIVIKKVVEEPFEKIVLFRFKDQDEHSPDMYWITKKEADVSNVTKLGISEEDIILLI